jgi:hypothetical protein
MINPFALVNRPLVTDNKVPEILMQIGQDNRRQEVMKAAAEKKKQADEANQFKSAASYAKFSGEIDPIFQEHANLAAQKYTQGVIDAYNRSNNKGGFAYDPEVVRLRNQYDQEVNRLAYLTKELHTSNQNRYQLEKEGKYDIAEGALGEKLKKARGGDRESAMQVAEHFRQYGIGRDELYSFKEKYSVPTIEDIGKGVKGGGIAQPIEKGSVTITTRPAGRSIVSDYLADPRAMEAYGQKFGIDVSTPEGKEKVIDTIDAIVNPAGRQEDEPRVDNSFKFGSGIETKTSRIGEPVDAPSDLSSVNKKVDEMASQWVANTTEQLKKRGSSEKEIDQFFETHSFNEANARKSFEDAAMKVAKGEKLVPVVSKQLTQNGEYPFIDLKYGNETYTARPQGFTFDKATQKATAIVAAVKTKNEDGVEVLETKRIPITPENWSFYATEFDLGKFVKDNNIIVPKENAENKKPSGSALDKWKSKAVNVR